MDIFMLDKDIRNRHNAEEMVKIVREEKDLKRRRAVSLMEDKYYKLKNSGKPAYMYKHLEKYGKEKIMRNKKASGKMDFLISDKS